MKEKRISGGIDCCGVGELNKEEKETIIWLSLDCGGQGSGKFRQDVKGAGEQVPVLSFSVKMEFAKS